MLRRALQWLLGDCPRCDERGRHLDALERRYSDVLNRLMSRDYGQFQAVQTPLRPVPKAEVRHPLDELVIVNDGLS